MQQCCACGGGPEIQSLVHPCGCGGGEALHIDCVSRWTPRRCPSCGGGFGWRAYVLAQRWVTPLLVILIMLGLWVFSVCLALVSLPPPYLAEHNIFGARMEPTVPVYLLLGGLIFGVISFFIAAVTFVVHLCVHSARSSSADDSCSPSFVYLDTSGGGCGSCSGGGDDDGHGMLACVVIMAAVGLAAAVFAIYWYVFEALENARRRGLVATLSKDGRMPSWRLRERAAA